MFNNYVHRRTQWSLLFILALGIFCLFSYPSAAFFLSEDAEQKTSTSPMQEVVMGDVNCDGVADSVDALFILQYDIGLRDASESCPNASQRQASTLHYVACDVNGDEACGSVDALLILRCEIGRTNHFCPNEQESMTQLVAGNSDFAFDLYRTLSAEEDGNLIFSPYSISSALAMVYAGARGETELQMAETLHYTLSQELLHPAFKELDLALITPENDGAGGDEEFRLSIVNGLWKHIDHPFLTEYLDTITENYRAEVESVNFSDPEQREAARLAINAWVEEATENRIEELLKEGILTADTRLALINAIYFNAKWEKPFLSGTYDGDFTLLDGSQVSVPIMSRREGTRYAQSNQFEILEIDYKESPMSMIILMPAEGAFADVEQSLTGHSVTQALESMTGRDVRLSLPKFQDENDLTLNQTMRDMGMVDLFSPSGADLSGMDGTQSLFLAHLIHKSFISVDELGTEAAAATGGIIEQTSIPITVQIDRPFIYLIRDSETGSILFVGRVLDPSE